MSTVSALLRCFLFAAILPGCGPFPDFRGMATGDIKPPVLLKAFSTGPRAAVLCFNEPVTPVEGSLSITPTIQPSAVDCTDDTLVLSFADDLIPGSAYYVESTVSDSSGNQIRFITLFYGHNSRVPRVLINEFTTRGSGNHPDIVELLVLEDGNTSGMCVYEGVSDNWQERFVLPDNEVAAGDYILVHFKPDGTADEVNEIGDRTASKGKDASAAAWDYWVQGGNGLSGNNGVISVCRNPLAEIIDGVLYSNRNSTSDETYRGFGSKDTMLRADRLIGEAEWVSEAELVTPEDAVNPDSSTGTRSLNRWSDGTDTNSKQDWHTVPTRGETFGETNSDEVHDDGK